MDDSCVWPVDRTCLPADVSAPEDRDRLEEAINTAVGVLWALTGRQFGCQKVIARPCPYPVDAMGDYDLPVSYMPTLYAGSWYNVGCGEGGCSPNGPTNVVLPGPVSQVLSVSVEGVEIDADSWKLENSRLYRANGEEWPRQDLTAPLGEPGTWGVTYLRGVTPPPGAAMAVGQLAKEFWNVCTVGKCRLPKRTQQIQRQGITITRADPTDILSNKQTGLPEVDLWIKAHNPNGLDQQTVIMSPDYPGGR